MSGRRGRAYRLGPARRLLNALVRALLPLGLGPRNTVLLTVPGRRTGVARSTPVTLVEHDGRRWLVAPYGEVGWVRNVRAAGRARLRRGGRDETVRLDELPAEARAPILKTYATRVPVTRPFFDAPAHAPVEAFGAEAGRHPVFAVTPAEGGAPAGGR